MVEPDMRSSLLSSTPWWRRRRTIAFVIVLVLALWSVVAALQVRSAAGNARAGETSLRAAIAQVEAQDLSRVDLAQLEADLANGQREFALARASLGSLSVRSLGPLPVAGRQLSSARSLATVSDDLSAALLAVVRSARELEAGNSVDRVAFLRRVDAELAELQSVIDSADLGPDQNLVGDLAAARAEVAENLADLRADVEQYRTVTNGLAAFLESSDYLVLGANNAEMQLGTGMYLSVGQVHVENGDFELPGLRPSSSFFPGPVDEVLDPDVQARWEFLLPGNDFRKLGYSARFDEHVGPQAVEMWSNLGNDQVDGVIALDPFVLDALLGVVGEVTVDGERYGQGDTLAYLLAGQYEQFQLDERDDRQDRLSAIAAATVDRLGTSDWDPIEMVDTLRPMAEGRHLLAYSTDPAQQAAWAALGVDGHVPGDGVGVYLLNVGGSKLDPFVELSTEITTEVSGDERVLSYEVTVTNRASESLPRNTTGPWERIGLPVAGTYRARVAWYLPGFVSDVDLLGATAAGAFGPDGSVIVAATQPFLLVPGDERTFRLRARLPASVEELSLIPSGRFPAQTYVLDGDAVTDASTRTLELE